MARWLACTIAGLFGIVLLSARGSGRPAGRAVSAGHRVAARRLAYCTIVGTPGDDLLVGTDHADAICGLGGNDRLVGHGGDDVLRGGDGNDALLGGSGNDQLLAGHGADRMWGDSGRDLLVGGVGRDRLYGGPWSDHLMAGDHAPFDRLDGGIGLNICSGDPTDYRVRCTHPMVATHGMAIPILMYHVIAVAPPGVPNLQLWVAPKTFARQMNFLASRGYHVISLQQAWDYWHGASLPSRPIVISFDDGFAGHYWAARPILARHGWAGTLNLIRTHVNQGSWSLSTKKIRGLIASDWEIDSHTLTHPALTSLSQSRLWIEVAGSRAWLRSSFAVPARFFCYPAGIYDSRVIAAVHAAGYLAATTTELGRATPLTPYSLDRVRVNHGDGIWGLAAHLHALGLPT